VAIRGSANGDLLYLESARDDVALSLDCSTVDGSRPIVEDFVLDNFLLFIHLHAIDIGIVLILMRPFDRECSNPLTRTTFVPQPTRPTPFE